MPRSTSSSSTTPRAPNCTGRQKNLHFALVLVLVEPSASELVPEPTAPDRLQPDNVLDRLQADQPYPGVPVLYTL